MIRNTKHILARFEWEDEEARRSDSRFLSSDEYWVTQVPPLNVQVKLTDRLNEKEVCIYTLVIIDQVWQYPMVEDGSELSMPRVVVTCALMKKEIKSK